MLKADKATSYTRAYHQQEYCNPVFNWADKQDFAFAIHGLKYEALELGGADLTGLGGI